MPVLEDWRLEPMPLFLTYAPNRHVSAKLRAFFAWAAALLTERAPIAGRCGP